MSQEHENFIKSPKQLITIVVLAFVIPISLFLMLSQLMSGQKRSIDEAPTAVAERIKPIGELAIAGPKVLLAGDKVYEAVCHTCHEAGLAGAHKLGDTVAWSKVIAQGQATTVAHALSGIRAMPPRGGNPDLTDEEVAGGVVFMVNKAGANWKAPELKMPAAAAPVAAGAAPAAPAAAAPGAAAPAPMAAAAPAAAAPAAAVPAAAVPAAAVPAAAVPAAATAPAAAAPAAPSAAPAMAAAGAAGKGKATYDATCVVCHAAGVAGAPKLGDKALWAPRIATGIEALYNSALKGKNVMPPKGGNPGLADADVKAAVDYMVSQGK